MPSKCRIRPVAEVVDALQRHADLLKGYAHQLFDLGRGEYAGEVAGKLSLLVTKSGSNTPLLIRLMRETGIEPLLTMGGPPIPLKAGEPILAGRELTMDEFLKLPAIGVTVPTGEFMMISKYDFIELGPRRQGAA